MDPHQTDRLTLYGSFTSSSSYKPMLYLALARLPFSFRTVNLKTGVQKTSKYLALNRWGVVPSLRHRGLTILQSNVILDYLARETGHFEGRTEQQRWQAREWLSWEADHITYVAKVRHSARFRAAHPETIAEYRPRAEAALSFVDKTIETQPFLVGDYCTIADIGCWGRMVFMAEGGFDIPPVAPSCNMGRAPQGDAGLCTPLRSDPQQGSRIRSGLTGRASGLTPVRPVGLPESREKMRFGAKITGLTDDKTLHIR
jgi:glutathione S-transferase